jgi:hypothetical protein
VQLDIAARARIRDDVAAYYGLPTDSTNATYRATLAKAIRAGGFSAPMPEATTTTTRKRTRTSRTRWTTPDGVARTRPQTIGMRPRQPYKVM